MQPTDLTMDMLFEAQRPKLRWQWVVAHDQGARQFHVQTILNATSSVDLVGYLNFIHAHRIPVLGTREVAYLQNPSALEQFRQVLSNREFAPPAVIVADSQQPGAALTALCEQSDVPLFVTNESAAYVVEVLEAWLSKIFAQQASLHGVFMDIFGMGVLLQGESGLGKSELGLELISRGHALVADDVVDFALIAQGVIEGHCPPLLTNLLEVRGIGLLDVHTIFGETAIRRKMRLRLIAHLIRRDVWDREYERLPTQTLTQDVLGVPIRKVMIPVEAGRNMAVLVEAAVRNTILQFQGIDTYQIFTERQRQMMRSGEP